MEARVQRSMVVTLFLVVGACQSAGDDVEQIRSNIVTNASQRVFIPAYFDPDDTSSWDQLIAVAGQGKITVIVNGGCESIPSAIGTDGSCVSAIGGGPGTHYSAQLANLIGRLRGDYGAPVLGYVSFRQGRPAADIQTDIDNWSYGASHTFTGYYSGLLDGVFFDEAPRDDSGGLPKALYFNDQVQHHFTFGGGWMPDSNIPGAVVFNWGGLHDAMPPYLDCLLRRHSTYDPDNPSVAWNYFVTSEAYLRTFTDNTTNPPHPYLGFMDPARALPAAFMPYNPFHFISIAHDFRPVADLYPAYNTATLSDQSSYTIGEVLAKARALNTGHVWVTDLLEYRNSNPYETMPASSIFAAQLDNANQTNLTYPNGSQTDQQSSSCPSPSPNE